MDGRNNPTLLGNTRIQLLLYSLPIYCILRKFCDFPSIWRQVYYKNHYGLVSGQCLANEGVLRVDSGPVGEGPVGEAGKTVLYIVGPVGEGGPGEDGPIYTV